MRVGITGATGFIGGALVPRLARQGHELQLLDDRTGPTQVTYPEWPSLREDFQSPRGLAALFDSDVVLHLAAVSGVMACAQDPVGSSRVNVQGTGKLVEMCRDRRIPLAFASSFAVVGAPESLPVTESTPARPTHEYARQKAVGEELVHRLAREGGVSSAVLRQSNVYGGYRVEGRPISKGNVIQLFARQAGEGRLAVNAPGTQRRDFVHIDDVGAHWEAVARYLRDNASAAEPRTFNVASGEALSVLEVAEKVRAAYSRGHPRATPVRIEVVPNPRAGIELVEPGFSVARANTERILGVQCQHTVDEALPGILAESDGGDRSP
ncbi:MAG: NAD(P)-dependent oxidoreductase [Thermoplasmata archaeon]